MSLPGLLVEYLITGACGIVWIWALFAAVAPDRALQLSDFGGAHATFAAPLAYVLGMVIDYVGRLAATSLRRTIADPINKKVGPALASRIPSRFVRIRTFLQGDKPGEPEALNQADILARSTELGRQYEMRSSRDRIARGVFANVVIASCVGAYFRTEMPSAFADKWGRIAWLAVLLTFAVWFRFHKLTRKFRHAASEALRMPTRQEPVTGPSN